MNKLTVCLVGLALLTVTVQANVYLGTNVVYTTNSTPAASTGPFRVRYLDYDGTVLSTQYVNTNGNATAPANPSRALLAFQGWNLDGTGITQNTDIGATYVTTSGLTYAYLTVDTVTGTNCSLYVNKSDGSTLTVDWGDGSTVSNSTATGNTTLTRAYQSNGNYVVTLGITSGAGTYGFGNGGSSSTFCGGSTQTKRDMLTSCLIGSNVISIGAYAFYAPHCLSSITIPTSVTNIGNYAFYGCYTLSSITIPANVTSIGTYAFNLCYALSSITIPANVTSIGTYAFSICYALSSITIPANVTSIAPYTFNGCYTLSSVTIPTSVTSIGNSAFYQCYALSSITIPTSVTNIGTYAFYACSSLSSVTIPTSVTNIAGGAFYACSSLSSVTIPTSVTNIGDSAFYQCYALRWYNVTPTNPPTLANVNAFTGINSTTHIYVPDDYYDIYTNAAGWSNSPIPVLYIYKVSTKP
jgi:hypothetical protein